MGRPPPPLPAAAAPWARALGAAREAAAAAARIQRERFGHAGPARNKRSEIDLVTDVDLASEAAIKARLAALDDGYELLAEESDLDAREGAAGRWLVDPLDGTTNYAHGHPVFAASVALEVAGEVVVGVVNAPLLGEEYVAARGGGAWLASRLGPLVGWRRLAVSAVADPGASLYATGFPYDRRERLEHYLEGIRRVLPLGHGLRRAGAASLDLCFLAAGRLDGYYEEHLNPWDTAAGVLLVTEAGGRVTRYDGGPFDLYAGEIVASNALIHDALVGRVRDLAAR